MLILLMLFSVLTASGLFLLSAEALKLPSLAAEKAMLNTGKQDKTPSQAVEAWLMQGAARLSGKLRLDPYKAARLNSSLKAAGMGMTPELFQAYALVKAGAVLLGIIPCLLVFPLLSAAFVFLAVTLYFKEMKRPEERTAERRASLELELPRFAATVEQELGSSRDVLTILENYKQGAGQIFRDELDVLTADMRSSSYEAALARFEARFCSPMLSDVCRGLAGVLRGDDSAAYFQMLARDFKTLEIQRLKAQAQKIPGKIRVFSFLLLACFISMYFVVIGVTIYQSIGTMF